MPKDIPAAAALSSSSGGVNGGKEGNAGFMSTLADMDREKGDAWADLEASVSGLFFSRRVVPSTETDRGGVLVSPLSGSQPRAVERA